MTAYTLYPLVGHPAVMTAYTLYPLVGHPGQSSSSHDCLYLIPLGETSKTVIQQS